MSCCGNKRREWLDEIKGFAPHKPAEESLPVTTLDKPARIFEYIGNHSLAIRGVTSGKLYHFRFKGDQLTVDHMDSLSMMAERDLKFLFAAPGNE